MTPFEVTEQLEYDLKLVLSHLVLKKPQYSYLEYLAIRKEVYLRYQLEKKATLKK